MRQYKRVLGSTTKVVAVVATGIVGGYMIMKVAKAWKKFWTADYADEDFDEHCGSELESETESEPDVGSETSEETTYYELPHGDCCCCCVQSTEPEGDTANSES